VVIAGIDVGILTVVCVLLLVAVILTTIKLIVRLTKKKDWQFHIIALVVLLIPLGIAGFFEGKQQYINYVASDITREVVGRNNVSAKCVRNIGDALDINQYSRAVGWAQVGGQQSKLDRTTCKYFYEWLLSKDRTHPTDQQFYAIHVIIHEAIHLSGEDSESETEYKTVEIFEKIAINLGINRTEAKRYNEYYKTDINPRLPEQYHVDWAGKEAEKITEESD